ncbi:glycosyl transferase [Myxozyma melibiosi]|uniref:Alpha-1,3-glucosyltransferase n=1 Tax=Myxozyma melibiosi TaxID=54550 RepID=A0ABR1F9B0_9ASCO
MTESKSAASAKIPAVKATDDKRSDVSAPQPAKKDAVNTSEVNEDSDNSPLNVFLITFKAARTQWVARQVIIMISLLYRLGVGLGPYSGKGTPPMYGDFEAQRHWMEITYHLPVREWYWYDLQYWGLDYPPVTAYHSWILGWIGSKVNSSWFDLDTSRGCEDPNLISYMRMTVVVSDLAVYIPAVSMFIRWKMKSAKLSPFHHSISTAAILLQPSLILIDHGHFQYNSVMLGLALLGFTNILKDKLVIGSIFFVLALAFKQMALYYALPVFAYLLGICIFPRINIPRFCSLAVSVLISFAAILAPISFSKGFAIRDVFTQSLQVVIRVFPFARGLWEDKVANFWCAVNTFVKLKTLLPSETLQRLSLVMTLISVLPAFTLILLHPRKKALIWGVSASAWGFFLFSFQVHEKSVLLPLMPTTLLLVGETDLNVQSCIYWINNIAMFSLFPLIRRDGLVMQFFTIFFLWNWLMKSFSKAPKYFLGQLVVISSYLAVAALLILELTVPPPAQYPDIWVVANVTLCFGCFFLFAVWNNYKLYKACITK